MDDHPTQPDPGQAPRRRVVGYNLDWWNNEQLDLTLHDLSTTEVRRVLDFVAELTGTRASALGTYLVSTETNKAGRHKGQKTALTPEQANEIVTYVKQRRAVNDRWESTVAELFRRYPWESYGRKWNERTLRRWVGE